MSIQRLLELHDLACDVARAGIRAQYPDADDQEVERRLRQRIARWHGVTVPEPEFQR